MHTRFLLANEISKGILKSDFSSVLIKSIPQATKGFSGAILVHPVGQTPAQRCLCAPRYLLSSHAARIPLIFNLSDIKIR
jgi:hypothetical protein